MYSPSRKVPEIQRSLPAPVQASSNATGSAMYYIPHPPRGYPASCRHLQNPYLIFFTAYLLCSFPIFPGNSDEFFHFNDDMPYYRNDDFTSIVSPSSIIGWISFFPTLMIAFSIRSLEQLQKNCYRKRIGHFHIQSLQHLGGISSGVCPPSSIDVTDWIFAIFSSSFANTGSSIKRHHLYDKSACTAHGIVFVHQDSQSYRGWNLFGCCKIIGQIFRDLPGLQDRLSAIDSFSPISLITLRIPSPSAPPTSSLPFSAGGSPLGSLT